jgi:hypothetical protein
LRAIEIVAAGDALPAPSVTPRLIAEFAARRDPAEPPGALADLTEREREITRLVTEGLTNGKIAGRLVIRPPPPRPTPATCCARSGAAIAPRSSRSPTNPGSC